MTCCFIAVQFFISGWVIPVRVCASFCFVVAFVLGTVTTTSHAWLFISAMFMCMSKFVTVCRTVCRR